jgi:flagellar protein FliO/FliZ
MIKLIPLSRAAVRAVFLALVVWLLAPAQMALAFTPVAHKAGGESTPLNLGPSPTTTAHATSSGGPSIVRTIVGLLVVIAVIWGLTWILKQVKSGREVRAGGVGLESVATLPLGTNRSLHLVRAGEDYLLLGSAEHGLVPIHRYSEQEARAAGLLEDDRPAPAKRWALPGSSAPARGGKFGEEADSLGPIGEFGGETRRGPGGRFGGESHPRGPIQIPGQSHGLLERLREWTVRR